MFRQTAGNLLPADDWVQQPQGFFFNNLPVITPGQSWIRGAPYGDAGRCFTANGTLTDVAGDRQLWGSANPGGGALCEGDCDTDDDCQGHLQCFERDTDAGTLGAEVPGCLNNLGEDDRVDWDYCYDPNAQLEIPDDAQWYGTYEEAVEKCAQLADCNMIHDWGCDGRNFRVCESAEAGGFDADSCVSLKQVPAYPQDFSQLNELESCRSSTSGKLHLKLVWPLDYSAPFSGPMEWRQTSNPLTSSDVLGYDAVHVANTGAVGLWGKWDPGSGALCEGDCDSDADCHPGLACFQRDDVADEVPGCGSGGTTTDSPWDYCYAPNPSTLVFAGDSGCASSAQCMACHGDCDTDADCQGALRCFQRDGSVQVPGCNVGQAGDVAAADYCYDPDGEPDGRVCVAAGANALNNADFESDVVSVNASLPPTGWNATDSVVILSGSPDWGGVAAPSGAFFVSLQGGGSYLEQRLSGLDPSSRYAVSFLMGSQPSHGSYEAGRLLVNGETVWESPIPLPEAFASYVASFRATANGSAVLRFENDSPHDAPIFIDGTQLHCSDCCNGADSLSHAGWVRVFRQTAGHYRPPSDWVNYNADDTSGDFSLLHALEDYRTDGSFLLKLVWPERVGANSQTWKQTTNPVTYRGGVEGYEAVEVNFHSGYWGGLEHGGVHSLLDGSVDHDNWHYAVGSAAVWQCGIPGPGVCESQVELWAWAPPRNASLALEVGTAWADESEVTIQYRGDYTEPIVVAGIPTAFGDEGAIVRILSTAQGSFDAYIDVPNHAGIGSVCGTSYREPEMFSWLVVESSVSLGDIQAGTVASSADAQHAFDWVSVVLDPPIVAAPTPCATDADCAAGFHCDASTPGTCSGNWCVPLFFHVSSVAVC